MTTIDITFELEPIGQLRPRAVRVGKSIRMYDPKKVADFKTEVKRMAKEKTTAGSIETIKGGQPLEVIINTFHAIPKSWSRKKRAESLGAYKITKYDLDNEIKSILDALNGILWEDDNQIAEIKATKRYISNDAGTGKEQDPYFTIIVKTLRN